MQHSREINLFIDRILAMDIGPLPGSCLDDALRPSIREESYLRRLFQWSSQHSGGISDSYAGLLELFGVPSALRTTRARIIEDEESLYHEHIIPIPRDARREDGMPSTVADLDEFRRNWEILTGGAFSELRNWDNIVMAGGSVSACLTPLSAEARASKHASRIHYNTTYPDADSDIFLFGLTEAEARLKIRDIYADICEALPCPVRYRRTQHTVTFIPDGPFRRIQIILRLYRSPAEIIAGFDIDAGCFLYDGFKVLANPRGVVAMMRQANTLNIDLYSPMYEACLAKYGARGFEIRVPGLERYWLPDTPPGDDPLPLTGLGLLIAFEYCMRRETTLPEMSQKLTRYRRRRARQFPDVMAVNTYQSASLQQDLLGSLSFWTEPGYESSFNPRNLEEWLRVAYLPDLEILFQSITTRKRWIARRIMAKKGFDLNQSDEMGRTPLRMAIISNADDIACDLLDAGAHPDFGMPALLQRLREATTGSTEPEASVGSDMDDPAEGEEEEEEDLTDFLTPSESPEGSPAAGRVKRHIWPRGGFQVRTRSTVIQT